jgi:hypothetical protein
MKCQLTELCVVVGAIIFTVQPSRRLRTAKETDMARIAPERVPDRFAFERRAKALRRQEIHRLMAAASTWLHGHAAALAHAHPAPRTRH